MLAFVSGCGGGDGDAATTDEVVGVSAACALAALETDPARLRPLVDRYVADSGASADELRKDLLDSLRARGLDLEATSAEEVASALLDAIDDDWRAGDSALIDGWIVSTTEVRLVAAVLTLELSPC